MELDLDEILKNLDGIANQDGVLTIEESNFLAKLRENITKFKRSIQEVLADGTITDDEFDELVIVRDKILTDAIEFESDSEDIKQLTKALYDQIDHYKIPGMLDEELDDHE